MTSARDDIAYRQALRYAEELRDLYHSSRTTAEEVRASREVTARIRSVLDGPGPAVAVQPIVGLRDRRAVGMEVLSRFPPDRRSPQAWFDEAERVGLREDLELRAIRAALPVFDHAPPGLYVAVNVSPETITSRRFGELMEQLPPDRVVLEVTEHAAVEDYEALTRSLAEFRRGGGRLAVDDAGAGFASLRHIVALQPDIIKLDISLTRNVDSDVARRSLARALISFASELSIVMVAEGIETPAEIETLRRLGVPYGQGFLLARPGPMQDWEPRLTG